MKQAATGEKLQQIIDAAFSALALLGISPLLAAIAVAIKIGDGGKILYVQERLGKGKVPFRMYKFRTMTEEAEKDGPKLTVPGDRRITRTGKFLRRYHLDELPQLWNVVKGDMRLIGPRPEREVFAKEIIRKYPEYEIFYTKKPGITSAGILQHGYASDVDMMVKRAMTDRKHFDSTPGNNLSILLRTAGAILKGKGI